MCSWKSVSTFVLFTIVMLFELGINNASGLEQIMPQNKIALIRAALPKVAYRRLHEMLRSDQVFW